MRRISALLALMVLLLPALALAPAALAQAVPVETPQPEAPQPAAPAPQPGVRARAATAPAATPPRQGATPAQAQPQPQVAPAPALAPGESDRLLRILRDDASRAELIRTLEALSAASRAAGAPSAGAAGRPAASPPPAAPAAPAPAAEPAPEAAGRPGPEPALLAPDTLGAQLLIGASQRLSALSDQLVAAAQAITDLPSMFGWLSALARDPVTQYRVLDASWKLALLFGLGLAGEWLAWRALRRPREALDAMAPSGDGAMRVLRKVPLVVGRLLLDLIPIGVFALIAYGLIGAVNPLPTTQLVLLTSNHAYVGCRAVMSASRMLFSPASAALRLVPCGDETAAYITVWLRRITIVLVVGTASAEAGLLFGLPWGAYDAVVRAALLIVTLFLVIVILQNRVAVAELLRAPELEADEQPDRSRRFLRSLRDRVAEIWHIIAILWLLAAWGVWALEIRGGFQRLLRVSSITLGIFALAKLVDAGIRRALTRGFRVAPELATRYPGLEARANRYLPVLKGIASVFIGAIAFLFLLEAWGLDAFTWFGRGQLGNRLLASLVSIGLTVVIAVTVWEVVNAALQRHLQKLSRDAQAARSARVRTLLPMLRTALLVILLVIVALNTLSEIGVNVAPLLAGAGVVGLAIGFGSQKLVQDVITGIFLLFEDAVAVGDVVKIGSESGVVEQLSIRSIKLRALDGSLHIIPFSAVTSVTNMTRDFAFAVLDVSVAYGEDTDRVVEVLREMATEMRADAKYRSAIRDELDVMGVEQLADSGVVIRVRLKTEPAQRWNVLREMNRRVKRRFDELGIEIPYPHQKLVIEQPGPFQPAQPPPKAEAAE